MHIKLRGRNDPAFRDSNGECRIDIFLFRTSVITYCRYSIVVPHNFVDTIWCSSPFLRSTHVCACCIRYEANRALRGVSYLKFDVCPEMAFFSPPVHWSSTYSKIDHGRNTNTMHILAARPTPRVEVVCLLCWTAVHILVELKLQRSDDGKELALRPDAHVMAISSALTQAFNPALLPVRDG